ncbi:BREX-2 system phosphatase PglZ [Nocardia niigatensis]|uniref:BREX-2 system phosphatase PglZ n=1 Tax=Nocardia niigatensis TaxID=209249 RepID=UPI0002D8473D|nr:BREX-2 system phosphatase PglZ [Nocardia niigatensis]
MTQTSVPTALRLSRSTVTTYLSAYKKIAELTAPGPPHVMLLRGEPAWEGDPMLALGDGRRARVVAAPSPLAVHEAVLKHVSQLEPDPALLVVITDTEEHDLDPAILARTHRNHVHAVDRWDIVRETFGAKEIDARLRREGWACEALLDAAGTRRWTTTFGGSVPRAAALTALAARRLQLDHFGDRITPTVLLDWSQRPGGPRLLLDLRAPERAGLGDFLSEEEQCGPVARILLALIDNGHGSEAVAYGLLCAALWQHAAPSNEVFQVRGRVERWLGDSIAAGQNNLDLLLTDFGSACEDHVRTLLTKARDADSETGELDEHARQARKSADTVVAQAETLMRQFGAQHAAAASPMLGAGLSARFHAAGQALGRALGTATPTRAQLAEIDEAVTSLRDHELRPDHTVRYRRVRMAQRLIRWLHSAPDPTAETVAAALDRQMRDTAWVDRAADYLEAGGDDDPALRTAYQSIGARVRELRREFDREFAKTLAVWTESGTTPGAMITVETFLDRVARPVAASHRLMLIVVDGLSAAIATELAGQLRGSFAEYDPLPGSDGPRRRTMAAALPSLTAVSRTSLFAGTLMKGDQKDEERLFPQHRFRGGKSAKIFHKNDLRGETGDRFGADLHAALNNPDCHIAVVLNTVDDRLSKEQKLGDPEWQLREIGDLRALLTVATGLGMAVLITSDHGHVIDRHGEKITAPSYASARHRVPVGEHDRLADTEITLHGPRVVWPEPGSSVVALWDNDSRYTDQKAGYHGGAALAEITIPILAFMPFGTTEPPKGWHELGDERPTWWKDETDELPVPVPTPPAERSKRTTRKATEALTSQMSLDIPVPDELAIETTPSPASPADTLITRLFACETFAAQLEQLGRKPPITKLEKAIRALLDGPQSTTAIAQRVGDPASRARGFAATLGQLLNVDGAQVLETMADGRTLRLHVILLRDQFQLR